jgi:ABC-2 type transport system permease protein
MKKLIHNSMANFSGSFVSELKESVTDAGTVLIFIVAVILYPMLYSIGYLNQTIRDIPVAVVDMDHSAMSRQYTRMLDATEQISVSCKPGSVREAEQLFYKGTIHGVILIPDNFEKEILCGRQADVTVYCDAGKFFVYKQVYSASAFATATLNAGVEIRSLLAQGRSWDRALNHAEGLNAQFFDLYNPSSGYCTFIVPGILIVVIQQSLLVGIGLLFGKNNERRKFIAEGEPIHTSVHSLAMTLGKATAYVVLYLLTTLVTLVLFYHWLSFPEKGSFLTLYIMLVPFLYAVSFMGMAIGSWFEKRVHALMFIVFISPIVFFLTGVAWPMESLPPTLKALAYIFPTTPMIPAFIKLRLIGGGINSIVHEWIILIAQMMVYFMLALISCRFALKSIKKPSLA